MSTQQEAPLSSGYRLRLGTTMIVLFLSIPVAVLAGNMLGSQLMGSLKEQLVVPASGDTGTDDQQSAFSPYGIAHSTGSTPGKTALNDPEGERAADDPVDVAPPESGDILKAAPVISIEPLIENQEVPMLEEGVTIHESGTEEAPSDPNSIFSMEETEPKRPKSYRIVLGTFGDPANADALVQDLLKDGYEPFVENKEPETEETTVQYRVLIGTFDDAADAGAVAEELRRLGYNAWLNTKT